MELKVFEETLKNNNALFFDDDYVLFKNLEMYNFKTEKSVYFKTFDELYLFKINGRTIKDIVLEKKEFVLQYDGGRGASVDFGEMGGGFGHARTGKDHGLRSHKWPAELNVGGRFQNYNTVLSVFKKKYANADHEYGVTVNAEGFVTRHIEGGKASVAISGGKGEMTIHNHPSGSNFSDRDLFNVSSTDGAGIVAVGTKHVYTFTKGKHFNASGFIKAVKKARWPKKMDYDTGSDWWLRRNAGTYGYTYTRVKS